MVEQSLDLSPSMHFPSLMAGRWLWSGLRQFTQAEWQQHCEQAASWQVQGLHPKIADGVNRWYDDAGLLMLKHVAAQHGLHVVPYHYCYGPQFGDGQIVEEARISAWAGNVFGAVIPDVEDQYMGQYGSAERFGKLVRALFKGLWMPTLYANPQDHPVPLLSLNPYMDAWLPQVYFAEWSGIAQAAIDYVYPQWRDFDQRAQALGQGGLKPILPIIALENNVAPVQIVDFITKMQHYGYIGFWHDNGYAPYTATIMQAPLPAPAPVSLPPAPPVRIVPLSFNDEERQVWRVCGSVSINEEAAIEQSWLRARRQRGWHFGPPLENEHQVVRDGRTYNEQQFSAARASYEVESGLLTWWTAAGPVKA